MTDQPHHRHSIRLPDFDYSQPGEYYITIVTHERQHLFGKIVDFEMQLNDLGKIVMDCWSTIPDHFTNVDLGEYVVMPNHFHGIIHIIDDNGRGTIYRAPTVERFGHPVAGSIPTIIRTFKAAVTRDAGRVLNISGIWQRNYFERVITSDHEYEIIEAYIANNPANWLTDSEYS
jgi:REP element-mobilizing transposase RayT